MGTGGRVGVGEKCWEKHGRSGTLWEKVGDVGALRDNRERAGSLEDLGLAFWMNYGEFLRNVGELTLNVDFHDKI